MRKIFSLIILLAILLCSSGCHIKVNKNQEYPTSEYSVVSVSRYTKTQTNMYGGVIKSDIAYYIVYSDSNGNIHEIKDFTPSEYGLYKLRIGDENKLVVEYQTFDTYKYLYLTQETLNNL